MICIGWTSLPYLLRREYVAKLNIVVILGFSVDFCKGRMQPEALRAEPQNIRSRKSRYVARA